MSSIQQDADLCILRFKAQQHRLSEAIAAHGLPIRMYSGQNTTLWRFADGFEFEVAD